MSISENIRESLQPMFQTARREGKWFWCVYQDLWWSPDELKTHQNQGRFVWGPPNWKLRDPWERVHSLERGIEEAKNVLTSFKKRIEASQVVVSS